MSDFLNELRTNNDTHYIEISYLGSSLADLLEESENWMLVNFQR